MCTCRDGEERGQMWEIQLEESGGVLGKEHMLRKAAVCQTEVVPYY